MNNKESTKYFEIYFSKLYMGGLSESQKAYNKAINKALDELEVDTEFLKPGLKLKLNQILDRENYKEVKIQFTPIDGEE